MEYVELLEDRILIKQDDPMTKTKSGLVIPDKARKLKPEGTVIACGPGTDDNPIKVKVGDKVIFNRSAVTKIVINSEDLMMVRQSNIFGIIKEEQVEQK